MTEGLDVDGVRVKATLRDWTDHLTTLFPEVRMKRVLEVRSADCGPAAQINALPAIYKGLLYDDDASAAALALMDDPTGAELAELRAKIAFSGFDTKWRGQTVLSLSERLLEIAAGGLQRLGDLDENGNDERRYLAPLVANVQAGKTYGEQLVDKVRSEWNGSLEPLWNEVGFWPET